MTRGGSQTMGRLQDAWSRHERRWKNNNYVYAVVSRRSRGLSIGINLNPGKACNFDCIYCQVDRSVPPARRKVVLTQLAQELEKILEAERDGSLYAEEPFSALALEHRGVRDIAFSGDGEPTLFRRFEEAVRIVADARRRFDLYSTRMVLLTNSTTLARPSIRSALALMDRNNGEVWAKLDAGTVDYFHLVNRARVPFQEILENITDAARLRPLVIQTLWARIHDVAPPAEEIDAYCHRVTEMTSRGAKFDRIQFHTIARAPVEKYVSPLFRAELERIADYARSRLEIPIEVFASS